MADEEKHKCQEKRVLVVLPREVDQHLVALVVLLPLWLCVQESSVLILLWFCQSSMQELCCQESDCWQDLLDLPEG